VDEIGINKVLVHGGVAVNLMHQSLLNRIGKTDKDLKPHKLILSNYKGKASQSLGGLQVSLTVETVEGEKNTSESLWKPIFSY